MGIFDSKWIVEFEYSEGFLSSYKKASMVVEASSEYSAKDKAKDLLKSSFKFVKIISAHKSSGKSEERNASFTPKITITETTEEIITFPSDYQPPVRERTPEEREALREEMRIREENQKRAEKEQRIAKKEKQLRVAKRLHIRAAILGGILSLLTFLFGWLPCWISLFKAKASQTQLEMWIELGHSETDETGQELAADIVKYTQKANSLIWIPFVVLAISILVIVIVVIIVKKQEPQRVEKITKELESIKSEEI